MMQAASTETATPKGARPLFTVLEVDNVERSPFQAKWRLSTLTASPATYNAGNRHAKGMKHE
jgi:hypothetical protein